MLVTKIAEIFVYFIASILGGFVACEVYAQVTQINTYAETVAALVMYQEGNKLCTQDSNTQEKEIAKRTSFTIILR